ncbi:hypothetical protein MVEN_00391000 [Mycena venus]|uniref:Uncharacterized protein n=1 Tax=Mycena venus TaxID=2733690 RepID=A0A8H6YV19_9AGAR|nr:hypothetical protein MVEN_00391000 [Mycena venus]
MAFQRLSLFYIVSSFCPSWVSTKRRADHFPLVPLNNLLNAITTKPPSFFRSAVRYIFLQGSAQKLPPETVDTVLEACPGIVSLASAVSQSISSRFSHPAKSTFTRPLFRNITHLEILDNSNRLPLELCTGLSLMPHLTHVAFNPIPKITRLFDALQANARLQCIVLLSPPSFSAIPDEVLLHLDVRYVCIRQTDFNLDWLRGASTGEDYWTLADTFIAAKRAGRVDYSLHIITDIDNPESWPTESTC